MPTPSPSERKRRLHLATEDLDVAQREVERAMHELTADRPRADKTIISEALRVAFERVAAARQVLTDLEHAEDAAP